jgi:DNA-directed RNA polymerase sigma subunit (sigma70/sigma32)
MIEITPKAVEILCNEIEKILDHKDIDFDMEKLIRMRYGLDGNPPSSFKELKKSFNLPQKKLKEKVLVADKKVFNLLKDRL